MVQETFRLSELRAQVLEGQTRSERWRRLQLERLGKLLEKHQEEVLQALSIDLRKPSTEAIFEIIALKQELKLANQKLIQWMSSKRISIPLSLKPGEAMVKPEPLGCVLIIGPWNYPFSLTLQPLISALAAGNTAVLKPSEQAPATSKLIAKIIPIHFPKEIVQVFEGDGNIASSLIEEGFDHIFFTGGSSTGRKVMAAAAKHLTPVTLELGGQSPAIVIEGADLETTARRLIWGKALNAGQTCIAPNHLLVQNEIKQSLLRNIKKTLLNFYGQKPLQSSNLAKIINDIQFNRLTELLNTARQRGQIIFGGEIDASQRLISPTLIEVNDFKDPLMEEELFGPLLPVLTIRNLDDALSLIRERPRPLALYMFGGTSKEQQRLLDTTSSGGVCFNDVVLQAGIPEMPFGGVGASGMGKYHGLAGFETFSHQKSILQRPFWFDLKFRYPPYKINLNLLTKLLE